MGVDTHSPQRTRSALREKERALEKTPGRGQATNSADRNQRPRGREAVMAAVLDAATTLFATRGPASVSVRDIAAAASVNHALVHRHFGSKQEVLRAVLERAVAEIAAAMSEIGDSRASLKQRFTVVAEHEAYWRALARAILDGENPRTLQRDFPNVRQMMALLQAEQQQPRTRKRQASPPSPLDARIVVGTIGALIMGWLLFEPFLLVATGLEQEDREKVREQVALMLQAMLESAQRV